MRKKTTLITGASGALGGHIIQQLEPYRNIVGLLHDRHERSYLFTEGLNRSVKLCYGEITDLGRLTEIISDYQIDEIYHCAAKATLEKSQGNPLQCFNTNILGTATVLEAARVSGRVSGILCMESDKSYGAHDEADLPYQEDQKLKPLGIYDVSKACSGLVALGYWHNFGVPVFTVRTANMYGPGDFHSSRLIPGSILRILEGGKPLIYKNVENFVREFLYFPDAARILIALMDNIDRSQGKAFNVGSGYHCTIRSLIDTLCHLMKVAPPPASDTKSGMKNEIPKQYLDLTRLKSVLPSDVTDCTDLTDALTTTICWYKKAFGTDSGLLRPSASSRRKAA